MKKKNNLLILVDTIDKYNKLKEFKQFSFLFPLENFCVGYNTFSLEDIPNNPNNYILVNRLLDSDDIEKFELISKQLKGITKGIIFEDIGIYEILKDQSLELIWFQNHFGTNSEIINFWLNLVDSCVVSYDITNEEIENICTNAKAPLVVKIFGYNQIMYSRRTLLSNYQDYYKIDKNNQEILSENVSKQEFIINENQYGTVILNKNIFDGRALLNLPNIKYFLIDTALIDTDTILSMLENIDNLDWKCPESDFGHLYTPTIYKLKEDD